MSALRDMFRAGPGPAVVFGGGPPRGPLEVWAKVRSGTPVLFDQDCVAAQVAQVNAHSRLWVPMKMLLELIRVSDRYSLSVNCHARAA